MSKITQKVKLGEQLDYGREKNYITLVGSIAESGKDDTCRLTVFGYPVLPAVLHRGQRTFRPLCLTADTFVKFCKLWVRVGHVLLASNDVA